MTVYVDTSVLVAWYVGEPGSPTVDSFLTAADEIGTAAITLPEAVAAIARKVRQGEIDLVEGAEAVTELEAAWPLFRRC